jgi:hypothetical protein
VPAPTPIPGGPPLLAPGGPAASPVVPLPERAGPTAAPAGPVGTFRFAPALEAVGPLRVRVFGTVEEEFTDNARQTKDNKQTEFRTSLAPGIEARIDRPNTSAQAIYAPRYVIRSEIDSTLDQALTLRGRWRPTAFIELGAGDDLIQSTDFRDVEDPGSRRRTSNNGYLQNRSAFDVGYVPQWGRVGLSYAHTLVLNEAEDADDSQTHVVRPDFLIRAPRWSLGGGYAATRGEFNIDSSYWEHTLDARYTRVLTPALDGIVSGLFTAHEADDATAIDFTISRARLGGGWTLTPEQRLEVVAGFDVFDPSNDDTAVRPSGALSYTQRFPWFALSATYDVGYRERFQDVDNAGVAFTQTAALLLQTTAFRALTGTAALRWTYSDFEQSTTTVTAGTTENTWDLELGLRYQFLRPLFASAGYVLTVRSSDDPNAEFVENRIRLSLTYTFDLL